MCKTIKAQMFFDAFRISLFPFNHQSAGKLSNQLKKTPRQIIYRNFAELCQKSM